MEPNRYRCVGGNGIKLYSNKLYSCIGQDATSRPIAAALHLNCQSLLVLPQATGTTTIIPKSALVILARCRKLFTLAALSEMLGLP